MTHKNAHKLRHKHSRPLPHARRFPHSGNGYGPPRQSAVALICACGVGAEGGGGPRGRQGQASRGGDDKAHTRNSSTLAEERGWGRWSRASVSGGVAGLCGVSVCLCVCVSVSVFVYVSMLATHIHTTYIRTHAHAHARTRPTPPTHTQTHSAVRTNRSASLAVAIAAFASARLATQLLLVAAADHGSRAGITAGDGSS